MCGIAGQLAYPHADPVAVRGMSEALAHRGPDGDGFYAKGPIALGHRRLSIIDLQGGAQPQFNEDGTVAVVFNGEIYNYRELAAELSAKHRFQTVSDTEVLVHLYEELGERMVDRLEGMFAFAIWDEKRQRLFAARDRFGEKPFYYLERSGAQGTSLTFASELRALTLSRLAVGAVDRRALSDYLELLYIPAPRTIYEGVKKLPAGHSLVADRQGIRVRCYWATPVPGSQRDPPVDLVGQVRASLRDAVRLRLRSDVPIAALLSGGLDSSAVVALMAQELGPGVKTFSVGFGRADDELPFARQVARRWNTDHHEILVTSDLVSQVTEGLSAYGEPFGDSSAVPTVAVCKEVAKEVKVVLTGDGGDELFAGYGQYRTVARIPHLAAAHWLLPVIRRLPESKARRRGLRLARMAGSSGGDRHRALIEVFSPEERSALLGEEPRCAAGPRQSPSGDVDAALAFDLEVYLPDDLLMKTDIAAMRWGLEGRCPLLDSRLAGLAIPPAANRKQSRHEGKLLLRQAVGEFLPAEILSRPKRGFGSPVAAWLSGPLRSMLEDLVGSPSAKIRSWLDGATIDRIVAQAVRGRGNGHQAWALLALEHWAGNQASVSSDLARSAGPGARLGATTKGPAAAAGNG